MADSANDEMLRPIKRALLSVSDKTGLIDFARALHEEFDVTLLSTGGTAKALREAGLPVTDVSEVTGFPEIMAGRVKTLHPKIHGGILARRGTDDAVMAEHGIEPIDLVVVNLYPFEQTVAKPDVTYEEAVENIDIGGPGMVRAAAKNHRDVAVVVDPDRYEKVLGDLRKHGGATCFKHRQKLAALAFARTAEYDTQIAHHLMTSARIFETADMRDVDIVTAADWLERMRKMRRAEQDDQRTTVLRYGENPHQQLAFVQDEGGDVASVARAEQHHGKQLGYINLLDADAALNVVREWEEPACCIVKHATPCGVGVSTSRDREGAERAQPATQGEDDRSGEQMPTASAPLPDGRGSLREAFLNAHASDPLAAFGGVVALNKPIDKPTAEAMAEGQKFLEVIVAPSFDDDALDVLRQRWKNVRLLSVGPDIRWFEHDVMTHQLVGGTVAQDRDTVGIVEAEWKVVTDRQPTADELAALKFNWLACKHTKSNAVVVGGPVGTFGIGGGQVDRVAASKQAVSKAGDRAKGAVAASDAFFPFSDGPQILLDAGVVAIVQPGGSVRDQETIDLCNQRGVAMVFTGRRHFRH